MVPAAEDEETPHPPQMDAEPRQLALRSKPPGTVNPYRRAFEAYNNPAEPPGIAWNDMLSAHLNHPDGWVFSTPTVFACARRVALDWPDDRFLDPLEVDPKGRAAHVYIVAGRLSHLLKLIPPHELATLDFLTFQRRGYRVHRMSLASLDMRNLLG